MFRAAIARQTPLGKRVEPILAAGDARARRAHGRPDPRAPRRAGRGRRLRPRRLPAQPRAGRGAGRPPRRTRPAADCRPRAPGPRRGRASSGCSSGRPRRAAPTTRPRRSRAGSRSTTAKRRRSPSTTARAASSSTSTATGTVDEVWAEIEQRARAGPGGAGVIVRKSPAEIAQMGRAGRIVAETLALLGEAIQPGRHDGGARRGRGGVHPLAGRLADLQGLPRLSRIDLRLAERDGRPRHPGLVRARRRRHPAPSTSASRSAASSPTPRSRSRSGRSRPRPSGCSRSARSRSRRAWSSAGRDGGSRTSRTPSRRSTEEAGFSVVRSLVGHGVGPGRCTRTRRSPISASRAAVRCSRRA